MSTQTDIIAERKITEVVWEALEESWRSGCPKVFYPGDYIYKLPSNDKIMEIAQGKTRQKRETFIENTRDCDDFAYEMKALFCKKAFEEKLPFAYCFGIAWLNSPFGHALNWAIDDENNFLLFEPQTHQFVPVENYDEFYLLVI